ncbi:MAG: DMT family transporter [Deltaproteobacteria bacterium]|nr:DMT family transporter [Deltaproteobacteria bacterium]MCB9786344.1 DMT family transporter [Deltaproteobacteria bacterium]
MALGCALTWAASVILFKRAEVQGHLSPHALNLFKNCLAIALLAATLALSGGGPDLERPPGDWLRLIVSGAVGIGLADTLYFAALRRIGAGPLALSETIYSPVVVILSVTLLGEAFGAMMALGGAMVLGGVALALWRSERREPGGALTRISPAGVGLGLLAGTLMATGVVIAKPALARSGLIEATLVRLIAGVAIQLVWILPRPDRLAILGILRPQPVWRTLLPASFMGAYVAMLLWMGGMKYTDASVASILNQLTVVFTLLMAHVFLGELLTGRRLAGAFLAISGASLIVMARG